MLRPLLIERIFTLAFDIEETYIVVVGIFVYHTVLISMRLVIGAAANITCAWPYTTQNVDNTRIPFRQWIISVDLLFRQENSFCPLVYIENAINAVFFGSASIVIRSDSYSNIGELVSSTYYSDGYKLHRKVYSKTSRTI